MKKHQQVPAKKNSEYSLTVSRALEVLSLFSANRSELSLAEMIRETGLPKASILRFMQSMLMHEYIEQDPVTKRFRPSVELFRVGSIFGNRGLQALVQPILHTVTEETGFSTYFSVLRADTMLIVANKEGRGVLRYSIPVGTINPAHSTSAGQAALSTFADAAVIERLTNTEIKRTTKNAPGTLAQLLTRLRTVRDQGYAVSWEMSTPGVGSVSAAAISANGELAGVFSLGFGTGQITEADCKRLGLRIRTAADTLSAMIKKAKPLASS